MVKRMCKIAHCL